MIPISPQETYSSRYTQHWVPSTVAFQRRLGPPRKRIRYTSSDELCAASVLISLSPKAPSPPQQHSFHHRHPESPPSGSVMSPSPRPHFEIPYRNRWEHSPPHWGPRQDIELQQQQQLLPPPQQLQLQQRHHHHHHEQQQQQHHHQHQCQEQQRKRRYHHHSTESVSSVDSSCYSSEVSASQSFDSTPSTSSSTSSSSSSSSSTPEEAESCWHEGCTSLSLPEDDDVLSPLHCFMRRYCVEAFSATQEDVATPRYGKSHGVKVVVGQVGIRCLYCKHRPTGKRPERAVCYPSSLQNIYHSIETWQRRHSLVCSYIPPWVRKSIMELMESSKSRAGGRRKYWEDSAERLGMVDTSHGVRFSRTPGDLAAGGETFCSEDVPASPSNPVVLDEDRELVTPYLFLLLEQMQTCRFTEEDRTGGRSKIKDNDIGFPGMQCKHCHGKAGFGRYFPTSASALALANSDRNIYNHIKKCRRCPVQVKAELRRLSQDNTNSKNRRGLRKMFFNRVWERIHNNESR